MSPGLLHNQLKVELVIQPARRKVTAPVSRLPWGLIQLQESQRKHTPRGWKGEPLPDFGGYYSYK